MLSVTDLIRDGRHYDALTSSNDLPFYLEHARDAMGPVLEIGCGTGRITIPLAASGIEMTGVEMTGSMLAEARRKARHADVSVDWIEADACDLELDRLFAMIILPFNTLQFFRRR
ncbi:MAG: class I SAM-dependent methyltransferase [Rhodospirillales bacterium]|nr:class I SAM-dependent methyltransferase [Rhodospirillales bacterium]